MPTKSKEEDLSLSVEQSPADTLLRLEEMGEKASEYVRQAKAPNTRKAYRADWADFVVWCKKYRRAPLPARTDTVAYYLADRSAQLKVSTLQRRLATIAEAHRAAGHDSPNSHPQVRLVWQGIRREKGVAQDHMKPALTKHIRVMVKSLPHSLLGVRDRALLLLGFAGAMRRSELVSLDVDDLARADEGLVIRIRKSKTDQVRAGRKVGIPYGTAEDTCPVRAIDAWLKESGIEEGPLFRPVNRHGQVLPTRLSDRAVAEVVKRSLKAAGKSPRGYSAQTQHSCHQPQSSLEADPLNRILVSFLDTVKGHMLVDFKALLAGVTADELNLAI
jgi:site-specific recombinase XerD